MKIKNLILVLLFSVSLFSSAFAGWDKKPDMKFTLLYRHDVRVDYHELVSERFSAGFTYNDNKGKQIFKITPFFEARQNLRKRYFEREELGVEIGKDIFPWLYVGNAIQRGYMREDYSDRNYYQNRKYTESELRVMLKHNIFSTKLKYFVLDEYSYEFDAGKGVRNEVAIGGIIPITKSLEAVLNWRHIDRIPCYDSDVIEASLTFSF